MLSPRFGKSKKRGNLPDFQSDQRLVGNDDYSEAPHGKIEKKRTRTDVHEQLSERQLLSERKMLSRLDKQKNPSRDLLRVEKKEKKTTSRRLLERLRSPRANKKKGAAESTPRAVKYSSSAIQIGVDEAVAVQEPGEPQATNSTHHVAQSAGVGSLQAESKGRPGTLAPLVIPEHRSPDPLQVQVGAHAHTGGDRDEKQSLPQTGRVKHNPKHRQPQQTSRDHHNGMHEHGDRHRHRSRDGDRGRRSKSRSRSQEGSGA